MCRARQIGYAGAVTDVRDAGPDLAPGAAAEASAAAEEHVHDDAATLVELLHAAMRGLRRDAALQDDPLTPGQARLLRVLAHAEGPLRAVDLAARLDVAPRSVTTKVDQAEADGYVRRLPDPNDRRARLVELTDAGRAALARVWAERREVAAARLGRLAPAERAELLRMLRVVGAEGGRGAAEAPVGGDPGGSPAGDPAGDAAGDAAGPAGDAAR
jgi:DNA-binding MarR family transcriptional regulator